MIGLALTRVLEAVLMEYSSNRRSNLESSFVKFPFKSELTLIIVRVIDRRQFHIGFHYRKDTMGLFGQTTRIETH